jgi:hypothetical protein
MAGFIAEGVTMEVTISREFHGFKRSLCIRDIGFVQGEEHSAWSDQDFIT